MIYDPITRQKLTIVGKYPPQAHAYDPLVGKIKGQFRFAKFRYGDHLSGFGGGFQIGTERDLDINDVVADQGTLEIMQAYDAAPELDPKLLPTANLSERAWKRSLASRE